MKLYFFYTKSGSKLANKTIHSDAAAIIHAGYYADKVNAPVIIKTHNQHGKEARLSGVEVHPTI